MCFDFSDISHCQKCQQITGKNYGEEWIVSRGNPWFRTEGERKLQVCSFIPFSAFFPIPSLPFSSLAFFPPISLFFCLPPPSFSTPCLSLRRPFQVPTQLECLVALMATNMLHNIKHSTVVQNNTQLEIYIFGQVTQKQRHFKTSYTAKIYNAAFKILPCSNISRILFRLSTSLPCLHPFFFFPSLPPDFSGAFPI